MHYFVFSDMYIRMKVKPVCLYYDVGCGFLLQLFFEKYTCEVSEEKWLFLYRRLK